MWVAGDPACCGGIAEVAAAAAAECRGRVRQAHTTTGLAGGFGGDGATSWVADSWSRLWRCRHWVVLYINATRPTQRRPHGAHRCRARLLLRFAPALARGVTLRAPVQTRLCSTWCLGPSRLPPQLTGVGRCVDGGCRAHGGRLARGHAHGRCIAQPMLWACGFSASAIRRPYGLRRTSRACANCYVRRLGFGADRRLSHRLLVI